MTLDQSEQIESLFLIWREQMSRYRLKLGAPPASIYSRHAQTTDIYQDDEDIDDRIEREQGEMIEKILRDNIDFTHYNVVEVRTHNRINKISVFRTGRVKPEEVQAIYNAAKSTVLPVFVAYGLVKR